MKKLLLVFMLLPLFLQAQKKDSQLDAATTLSPTDKFRILQGGVSKMAPVSLLSPLTTYVTQTSNYTLSDYTATDGVCQNWVIIGNSTNTIAVPSGNAPDGLPKWRDLKGVAFDNTKKNTVRTCAIDGHIDFTVRLDSVPTLDVTPPSKVSASTNSAGTIITITFNETLGAYTPAASDFTTSPSKTISAVGRAGSTITVTVSTPFVAGNTITISYTQGTNKIQDVAGNFAASFTGYAVTNNSGDVTAPTLSSPISSSVATTTATIGVTTNEANGTGYAVVTTSATPPSAPQVKLGQNNSGTSAVYAGSQAITTTGAKTFSATGLTTSTTYYAYFMHEDAVGNRSTVAAASSFTTTSGAVVSDDFNRADGAVGSAPVGGAYTITGGTVSVVSNTCGNLSASVAASARISVGKTSWDFSITITSISSGGIAIDNYSGSGDYMYVVCNTGQIIQNISGVDASIGAGVGATIVGDVIRIVKTGNSISVYNIRSGTSTLIGTGTCSSTITSQFVGFRLANSSNSFDNLIIN